MGLFPSHRILGVPWWVLLAILIILGFLILAIRLFAPEIVKQAREQLEKLAAICVNLLREIGKFFFQLAGILWTLWGLGFALRWRLQFAVRYTLFASATFVLLVSSFYLCAELAETLAHGFKAELPTLYARLDAFLCSNVPALHEWLSTFEMPHIREIPFSLDIVLFVLALVLARHHLHGFRESLRREALAPALEQLFLEFDKFRKAHPTPDRPQKDTFLETLTKEMKEVLDKESKRDVAFSLMEKEKGLVDDEKGNKVEVELLKITFLPKDSPLNKTFTLRIGEGGAGKAYERKVGIYIPSVRHRIGIDLDHQRSVGVTYQKSPDKKKFGSILSVPVLVNSRTDAIAVVSVSSRKRKAFWHADFDVVRLMASIISTLY
jgi:hypothetical protein